MFENLKCEFHPNKDGIHECVNCRKSICNECLEVFKTHSNLNGNIEIDRKNFCVPCYCDIKISKIQEKLSSKIRKIIPIIVSIAILFITGYIAIQNINAQLSFNPGPQQIFFLLWILFLIFAISIGFLIAILKLPKSTIEERNLENRKERFLDHSKIYLNLQKPAFQDVDFKCPDCGEMIVKDIEICNFCGIELKITN